MDKKLIPGNLYKLNYEKSWFDGTEDDHEKCRIFRIQRDEIIMFIKSIPFETKIVYIFLYKNSFICDGYVNKHYFNTARLLTGL